MYQEDKEVVLCKGPTIMQERYALWLHFRTKSLTLPVSWQNIVAAYKINIKRAITFIYSISLTYFISNYLEDAMEKMTLVYINNK